MLSRICLWLRRMTGQAQKGQGLAEYGLMLVLISVVCVAVLAMLGQSVTDLYSHVSSVFPR